MKKTLIALAVLAAAGTSFAQSSVSMTGGLRIGVLNDSTGSYLDPIQSSGNQVNFVVVEDLGGGMKFNAKLHLRFWSQDGKFNNSGTGFQTTSMGLSGGFGSIEGGRIGLDQMWGYNPWGSNGAHVNPATTGGATENSQVRYTSPSFGGLKVALSSTFKCKQKTLESANVCGSQDGSQLLISYAAGPISATFVDEELTSGVQYSAFGASYDLGVAKVMMISGTTKSAAGAKTEDGMSFSVAVPMGAATLKAGMIDNKLSSADKTSFGLDYALSKRTTLEADFYKVKGAAAGQTTWIGVRHSF